MVKIVEGELMISDFDSLLHSPVKAQSFRIIAIFKTAEF